MTFYYCEPCVLHNRATVRYSDDVPQMPCPHFGDDKDACKRVAWVTRSWFCLSCKVKPQRTTIVYSPERPTTPCPDFSSHNSWVETDASIWVRDQAGVAA